jgi:hypothetical protein
VIPYDGFGIMLTNLAIEKRGSIAKHLDVSAKISGWRVLGRRHQGDTGNTGWSGLE